MSESSNAPTLLVISDSRLRSLFALLLRDMGWQVESCPDARESVDHVRTRSYALILFSTDQMTIDCRDLIRSYRKSNPQAALIALAVKEQMEQLLTLFPLGLSDALIQPYNPSKVVARLREILQEHATKMEQAPLVEEVQATPPENESTVTTLYKPSFLAGRSSPMAAFIQHLLDARKSTSILLITGPEGSEFESVVREWVHLDGDTEGYPIVITPEELDEDRLLTQEATNRLSTGHPLTVYLPDLQNYTKTSRATLLRFLGTLRNKNKKDRTLNLVLSSVDRSMGDTEQHSSFIEEVLYFVQSTVSIPALCERATDIPIIIRRTLFELTDAHPEWRCRCVDKGVIDVLSRYPWPGNYRELRGVLDRAIQRCPATKLTNEHIGPISQHLAGSRLNNNQSALVVS